MHLDLSKFQWAPRNIQAHQHPGGVYWRRYTRCQAPSQYQKSRSSHRKPTSEVYDPPKPSGLDEPTQQNCQINHNVAVNLLLLAIVSQSANLYQFATNSFAINQAE